MRLDAFDIQRFKVFTCWISKHNMPPPAVFTETCLGLSLTCTSQRFRKMLSISLAYLNSTPPEMDGFVITLLLKGFPDL